MNEQENNNNNIENPGLSDISNADLRQNEPENNNSNIENPELSDISNADLRQNEPVEKEVSETEEVQDFSDFFQPQATSEASQNTINITIAVKHSHIQIFFGLGGSSTKSPPQKLHLKSSPSGTSCMSPLSANTHWKNLSQ